MQEIIACYYGRGVRPDLQHDVVSALLTDFRNKNPHTMRKVSGKWVFDPVLERRVEAHLKDPANVARAESSAAAFRAYNGGRAKGLKFKLSTGETIKFPSNKALAEYLEEQSALLDEKDEEIHRLKTLLREVRPLVTVGAEMHRLRREGIKPIFRVRAQGRRAPSIIRSA